MKRTRLAALAALAVLAAAGAIALAASGSLAAPQPGRRSVPAPIDGADVVAQRSLPPRYVLNVRAGLPSGCAERGSHEVERRGDEIVVTVLNTMPAGDPVCTMIYGTYELSVPLGSDFRSGAAYTVRVNDRTLTFTAE